MRLAFCLLLFGCGRVGFGEPTDDANASSDAKTANDAVGEAEPDALCTTLAQFNYNFDGTGSALWMPYTDPGMTLSESGNQLVIPLPNNLAGTAGYFSTCNYDLRGQRVFVTASSVPRLGSNTDMYMAVGSSGNVFGINITNGSTEAYRLTGNNYTPLASVPYNAAEHRIWQVRESGGQVFWELSADGASFTSLHSATPPFDVSAVQLLLFADAFTPTPNPGTAQFAKLNTP